MAPQNSSTIKTSSLLSGPQTEEEMKSDYVELTGAVEFMNRFGYLNAEIYPLIKFYSITLVIYIIMFALWSFLLRKYNEFLIIIHHFVTIMIVMGFIEALLMFCEYEWYNSKGTRSFVFQMANVFVLSFRTVASLIIILLISLGYGITVNDFSKYSSKIAFLSFIQFATSFLYWAIIYMNHS